MQIGRANGLHLKPVSTFDVISASQVSNRSCAISFTLQRSREEYSNKLIVEFHHLKAFLSFLSKEIATNRWIA